MSEFETTRLNEERLVLHVCRGDVRTLTLAACFFPGGARAGGREATDFFLDARTEAEDLLRSTDASAASMGASMGLDRTTELFSLSLELRSIETVRFEVGVVFSS